MPIRLFQATKKAYAQVTKTGAKLCLAVSIAVKTVEEAAEIQYLQNWLTQSLPDLLIRYKGKEIYSKDFAPFQQDGAKYYPKGHLWRSADILLTTPLDMAAAYERYERHFQNEKGATFTLYLIWTLLNSMQSIPGFNYRFINGKWYEFENLPLFTTIANTRGELNNALLENVNGCSWQSMCEQYNNIRLALDHSADTTTYPYPIYCLATHITNSKLRIFSTAMPTPTKELDVFRPMFVLGGRKKANGELEMSITIKAPHASLHPQLISCLLGAWEQERNCQSVLSTALRARL